MIFENTLQACSEACTKMLHQKDTSRSPPLQGTQVFHCLRNKLVLEPITLFFIAVSNKKGRVKKYSIGVSSTLTFEINHAVFTA